MVQFFVPQPPHGPAEDPEVLYARFAKFAKSAPLPPDRRIYSIKFVHDGEEWTATVGEQLHGRSLRAPRRGQSRGAGRALSDRATVLAIYRGLSTMVVTDAFAGRSHWTNPFMAGDEPRITLFDPPAPEGHDEEEDEPSTIP